MDPATIAGLVLGVIPILDRCVSLLYGCHGKTRKTRSDVDDLVKAFERIRESYNRADAVFKNFQQGVSDETIKECRQVLKSNQEEIEKCETTLRRLEGKMKGSEGGRSIKSLKRKAENMVRIFLNGEDTFDLRHRADKIERNLQFVHLATARTRSTKARENDDRRKFDFALVPSLSNVVSNVSWSSDGGPMSSEGELKRFILTGNGSTAAAAGARDSTHCAHGMGGVGKTCALISIGNDTEVQKHFRGGVFYALIGKEATAQDVTERLAGFAQASGGETVCQRIMEASSLVLAVQRLNEWLSDEKMLFLIDDVWDASFVHALKMLVSRSSKMIVSTRDVFIARQVDKIVSFSTLQPVSQASRRIFLAHAKISEDEIRVHGCGNELDKLLVTCGGLPLALAICGSYTFHRRASFSSVPEVLASVKSTVERRRTLLTSQNSQGYNATLELAVCASLDQLQAKYEEGLESKDCAQKKDVRNFFEGLSIVKNQTWMPLTMLQYLWALDSEIETEEIAYLFESHGLLKEIRKSPSWLKCSSNTQESIGFMIHDLVLDVCRNRASKHNRTVEWHTRLLNGYMKCSTCICPSRNNRAENIAAECLRCFYLNSMRSKLIDCDRTEADDCGLRPWWCNGVRRDDYIHENLARHLVGARRYLELRQLLLDVRWTKLRFQIGGILALEGDFSILKIGESLYDIDSRSVYAEEQQDFEAILTAIRCSWQYISKNERDLPVHLGGRLLRPGAMGIVSTYVKSVEKYTKRPYLLPKKSFLPDAWSSQEMEIRLRYQVPTVDYSPCGGRLAIGELSHVVICDVRTGALLSRFKGHENRVLCVSFIPGSSAVVSSSLDATVRIWDTSDARKADLILNGHAGSVNCVCASPDGTRVASGSEDKTVRLWDACTGGQIGEALEGHSGDVSCVSFSPDGAYIASGSNDRTIRLWHTNLCRPTDDSLEATGPVQCIAFSPDGKRIVCGCSDGSIALWDVNVAEIVGRLQGHIGYVYSVKFSRDGAFIASAGADKVIRLWDGHTLSDSGKTFDGHSDFVSSLAFSPDGTQIASASLDKTVRLWNVQNSAVNIHEIEKLSDCVCCAAFNLKGTLITAGLLDGRVGLFHAQSRKLIWKTHNKHDLFVSCIAFSPNGLRIASGSHDGTIHLWNIANGANLGNFVPSPRTEEDSVSCIAFSPDGMFLASGWYDRAVRIWELSQATVMEVTLQGASKRLTSLDFSSDGVYLLSRDIDGLLQLWDFCSRKLLWDSREEEGGKIMSDADAAAIVENIQNVRDLASAGCSSITDTLIRYNCDSSAFETAHDTGKVCIATLPGLEHSRPWMYYPKNEEILVVMGNGRMGHLCLRK